MTILTGEIIETYPEDKYGPSCLIRGKKQNPAECSMWSVHSNRYGLSPLTTRHGRPKSGILISERGHDEFLCRMSKSYGEKKGIY